MSSTSLLGGRYRLVERLGGGGMSVVWRGYDEVLGRSVAVKLLTASYAADLASRARIRAEGQVAARLSHPHICRVYDYGESLTESGDRVPFLVMELLSGTTLADQLRAGPLPVRAALRLTTQVASALAAAHRAGLVHRDIKPGNIMLTASGPKVVDFGIAAAAGEAAEPRQDGEVWGTPAYVAPERLTGGEVVPASDVYALGLLLYRMLTGTAPWQVETVTEVLSAHAYQEPAPLPEIDGLPAEVADLCLHCLAKDPAQRPLAADVAEQLAEAGGWRLSTLTDGVLVDGDDRSMLPPAARNPGDRAQFARAVFGGAPAGQRRWPAPRPAAGIRPAAPAGPTRPAPVTVAAGSPPGTAGAARRRFALRHNHRRWAALTAASLVAVLTVVFGGLWIPSGSANRYLGFEVAAAPPGAGLGPSSTAEPPAGGTGQGAQDSREAPSVSPSGPASGGGGGAPVDPLAPGGSGATGSDTGAGSGSSGGSAPGGGSSSGSAPGSGSSGSGSGTSPASPPPPPPPPPPSPVDPPPPPPPPSPAEIAETFDTALGPVTVICVGATATLLPPDGLPVGSVVNTGPGSEVGISVLDVVELRFECRNGVPVLI